MRMVKVEKASEIALEGIKVEYQVFDKKLEAIVITDKVGNSIRIMRGNSYDSDLKVMKEQPYDTEVHIFVEGVVLDTKVSKSFGKKDYDSERAAQKYLNDYECKLRHGEESPFTIVKKSVKVEYSTGNVLIDDVGEITKETSQDSIPF